MADVGKSTAAHLTRHELHYPVANEALENFGAWWRSQNDGAPKTSVTQPMFRFVVSGYRTATELRDFFDEVKAVETDQLMAAWLTVREQKVILCRYVYGMPGRAAAKNLTSSIDPVSKQEYSLRLEAAVAKLQLAMDFCITSN